MTLKQKLKNGTKIYGTMLRIVRNPAVCQIAKNSGLDFVMYDCEHSNYNMETLHDLFLMGNALGLGGFVRVPNHEKQYISRTLDQGAIGVMAPMTETTELAERLVCYSKYQPIGERGFSGGIAHTGYRVGKHAEIMEAANDSVISIAQIETRLSVDNAEAIANVNGIDALLIGPNDLSISLGVPGDLFNPIVLEAIAHVGAACQKHNKAFGLHAGQQLIEKFADQLSLIMIQSDTDFLAAGFSGAAKSME